MTRALKLRSMLFVPADSERKLANVVRALRPPSRLTGRLDGRQQERHQHADDGDYD